MRKKLVKKHTDIHLAIIKVRLRKTSAVFIVSIYDSLELGSDNCVSDGELGLESGERDLGRAGRLTAHEARRVGGQFLALAFSVHDRADGGGDLHFGFGYPLEKEIKCTMLNTN